MIEITMTKDAQGVYHIDAARNVVDRFFQKIDASTYQLQARASYLLYERHRDQGHHILAQKHHKRAVERYQRARELLLGLI